VSTLRWKDDLDDDGKPWRSRLELVFPRRPWPRDTEWLAKITRLRGVPSTGQPETFHFDIAGGPGGFRRTMRGARAVCLRWLRVRSQQIIEALGGKVTPPKGKKL